MKKFGFSPLHIFFDKEKLSAWPSGLKVNPEKEKALKLLWDITWAAIITAFKPWYTRTDALKKLEEFERGISQALPLKTSPKEGKDFFDLMRQFITHTDIFGKDGKYDMKKAKWWIENLIKELNKTTGNKLTITIPELDPKKAEEERVQKVIKENEVRENTKKIEIAKFRASHPIKEYANILLTFAIEHPIRAKRMGEFERHIDIPMNLTKKDLPEYFAVIETIQLAMQDDMWNANTGALDKARQNLRELFTDKNRTYDEFEKAVRRAVDESIRTKSVALTVWWDQDKNWKKKYETQTMESVAKQAYSNPEQLNQNAIKLLTSMPDWENRIKEYISPEWLKWLALYLAGRWWNSKLISQAWVKSWEIKIFFENILNESQFENIRNKNITELYSEIPSIQSIMSEQEFVSLFKDGNINITLFAKKLIEKGKWNSPAELVKFRENFIKEMREAVQRNLAHQKMIRKTIADDVGLDSIFPGLNTKYKNKSPKLLTPAEAEKALLEINEYLEKKKKTLKPWEKLALTPDQETIKKLLETNAKLELAGKITGITRWVLKDKKTLEIAWQWPTPWNEKKFTDTVKRIEAAGKIGSAQVSLDQQKDAISERKDLQKILQEYGTTIENLHSDIWAAIKIYEQLLKKKNRTPWENELFHVVEWIVSIRRQEAEWVRQIIESSKDYNEARQYIAETTDIKAPSRHELVRYEYIDKYYNTPAESRDYSQFEKTLTSIPPGERISVKDIPGVQVNTTSDYINNISVIHNEWWGIGEYTITDAKGVILAKNIPLENIPAIMSNAEMLNQMGCEVLTPYMELMKNHLWLSEKRSNSFDGTFTYEEQVALIQNLSQFLYGTTIQSWDIVGMIRELNAQNPNQNHPNNGIMAILRTQKHILSDGNTILTHEFQKQMEWMRKTQAKSMG